MMTAGLLIIIIFLLPYLIFRKGPHPKANHHYDAMLILGCPTNADGSLSTAQAKRLALAEEYATAQYVNAIIISGAAVKNDYTEAVVLKNALQKKGVTLPIYTEEQARNTFQNFRNTKAQFGTLSLLVITGNAHVRRAYFFARKFFPHPVMGVAKRDSWKEYVKEYLHMWIALYWEVKLFWQNHRSAS